MTDIFSKKKRSEVMSKIRSKGTKIELKLKVALRHKKIKFEYQPRLFGKPDFLVAPRTVVFCDSSFWHGRNWNELKRKLSRGKNRVYWLEHIQRNAARDKKVTARLRREGFTVIRLWDTEINSNPDACVNKMVKISKKGNGKLNKYTC